MKLAEAIASMTRIQPWICVSNCKPELELLLAAARALNCGTCGGKGWKYRFPHPEVPGYGEIIPCDDCQSDRQKARGA
jgi:hypothetical protein